MMSRRKLVPAVLAALVWGSLLGASGLAGSPAATARLTDEPCAPVLTPPTEPDVTAPSAPKNLRIIGGGGADELFSDDAFDQISGPYAWPETAESSSIGVQHAYFDMLVARPDCLVSFHLRSQLQLDSLPTAGRSDFRIPVLYDPVMDAARFAIDPSGATANSGSTDTMQKRPYIRVSGVSSMLLTWETRFDPGFLYETGKLEQHKTWKLTQETGDLWLTWKTNYKRGANQGMLAELLMASQTKTYLTGGTSNSLYGSEILGPRVRDFYIRANRWTRYWFFVEGTIAAGNTVYLSAWAADEDREPMQLYDRLPYLSPGDIRQFHIFYDSSQDTATNTLSQSWNRNVVILTGLSRAAVTSLLQKPTY